MKAQNKGLDRMAHPLWVRHPVGLNVGGMKL